jgi:hypothetical protein
MSSQTLQLIWPHHGASTSVRASTGFAADRVDVAIGPLAVRTRRLAGGLRDGVLLVELVAGTTKVFVLPDRGLGIWKMMAGTVELGWQSPVHGPVHPRVVPLAEPSGLGWLDGFDELMVRCGLVSNGAPDFDGHGQLRHPLHGRIANLPAHHLDVTLDDATGTITLTGAVDETRFLVHALRMTTSLTLHADRPRISWTDTVKNVSDRPATMQMLYHVNFGPPLLGPGAELVAAVEELAPRDEAAVGDVPQWNRYAAPQAGRGEQAHYLRVRPDESGRAEAVLVGPDRRNAAALSWRAETLPCFTLWKNQGGLADGFVTGLEPGTNYPNRRSFEESQNRVVPLAPGGSVRFDLALEHLNATEIDAARARLGAVAAAAQPVIHAHPKPGWSRC